MKILDVSTMSGLTRYQIDQLISRHGIVLHAKPRPGAAREFTPADAFLIFLAGKLHEIGLNNSAIAAAVASVFPKVDSSTFDQVEIYPDRATLEAAGEPVYAVISGDAEEKATTEFVRASMLADHLRASESGANIVIPASVVAFTIERLDAAADV